MHQKLVTDTGWRLAPSPAALRVDSATPDVIVLHFTAAWRKLPFIASLRLRAGGARIILVEHSYTRAYERLYVSNSTRFRAMLRLAYACVDQVVAVSDGQGRWLLESGLVAPRRLAILRSVLDLKPFASVPAARSGGLPLCVGAFGRFDRQKGFDTLIEAMRQVPAEIATLEMAGYGPDEADLRQAAEGLSHVRIQGRVDPVAFLAGIDVVAIPSRYEAGAVTCWEVRAAGRPVIVTDVDGLPEQVPPEIGLVVPPEDPERLARAIIAIARADRAPMRIAARKSTEGAYAATLAGWRAALS